MEADIVGYIGGFVIALALFPQVRKTWRSRSAKDISLLWTVVYLIGLGLMIVYGTLISNPVIIITIGLEAFLLFVLFVLKVRFS